MFRLTIHLLLNLSFDIVCNYLTNDDFSYPSLHNINLEFGKCIKSRGIKGLNPYATSKGEWKVVVFTTLLYANSI